MMTVQLGCLKALRANSPEFCRFAKKSPGTPQRGPFFPQFCKIRYAQSAAVAESWYRRVDAGVDAPDVSRI